MIIKNRRVTYDYNVLDTVECGMVLTGEQVKACRLGAVNLKAAWCEIRNYELFAKQLSFYGNPTEIKLLAHKREVMELRQKLLARGVTLIPTEIHESRGRFKIVIGLCKGKSLHDKREALKERVLTLEELEWM